MKKVLIFTASLSHRRFYAKTLEKYFAVTVSGRIRNTVTIASDIDAVVYDVPKLHSETDLENLQKFEVPVVVLTCEDRLPLPPRDTRRVLTYPVRKREIVDALLELLSELQP